MPQMVRIRVPAENAPAIRRFLETWEELEREYDSKRAEQFIEHLIDACDQLWAYTADAGREKQSE
jgi:hypothetical protein